MKRIVILILALCLILCLAACGGGKVDPASTEAPKTEAPKTEAPKTEAPKTEAPTTEAPTTEAPETEAPSTEAPATEPDEELPIRGEQGDDAYVNETLKLRIVKPAGWFYFTDEQIAEANNLTAELMEGDTAELIKEAGQLMDMMMMNGASNNINLIIQPVNVLLSSFTDEQIYTLSEDAFRAQFASSPLEIKTYEVVTKQVGGEDRTVLHMILASDGTEADEYQIWFRENENYMGIMTLTIMDGSDPQPILDGISTFD